MALMYWYIRRQHILQESESDTYIVVVRSEAMVNPYITLSHYSPQLLTGVELDHVTGW